ncbi:MAG: alkaline phosphatase family protein [Agathobacter sp.]
MQKLIVISIDALTDEGIRREGNMPNLNSLIDNGAYIKEINGIYPSLTHPCHATIITGKTPRIHGIVSNTDYKRENHPWFNNLDDIKCPTVIDYFKERGASVACCRWPLTAGGFNKVDYLIPEINDVNDIKRDCLGFYLSISSPSVHNIIKRHIDILKLKKSLKRICFPLSASQTL